MASAVLAIAGSHALAQPGGPLPATVIQNPSPPNAEQKQQISAYVTANSSNLAGPDAEKFRRDREALLAPLADANVSTQFRLEYGRALKPMIEQLVRADDEIKTTNALFMAGELATTDAIELIKRSLAAPTAAVRYSSAAAMGRAFAGSRKSPAILPDQIRAAAQNLGDRLTAETDPIVLDSVVLGLLEAARIDDQRAAALDLLGDRMAQRVRARKGELLDAAGMQPVLRAVKSAREALAAAQGAAVTVPAPTAKAAADLAASALAHAVRVVESGGLPPRSPDGKVTSLDAREQYAQLAQESETVLQLAAQVLGRPGLVPAKGLAAKLRAGSKNDDAGFGVDVKELVGPGGVLAKEPFLFAGNRFL